MPNLLYGIYVYREQLKAAGDTRFLEILCVTDGDIRKERLEKTLEEVHHGINVPEDMKDALALVKDGLRAFNLENTKRISGLPEYHHQLWLNEITPKVVDAYHQEELKLLYSILKCAKEEDILRVNFSLISLNKEISEVNRIADASRGIPFHTLRDDRGLIDCHNFYGVLKGKLSRGDTLMKYSLHRLEYSVLSIIRKYNPDRWRTYISPVKDAMEKAFDQHVKMFTPDRFNFTELGGG